MKYNIKPNTTLSLNTNNIIQLKRKSLTKKHTVSSAQRCQRLHSIYSHALILIPLVPFSSYCQTCNLQFCTSVQFGHLNQFFSFCCVLVCVSMCLQVDLVKPERLQHFKVLWQKGVKLVRQQQKVMPTNAR